MQASVHFKIKCTDTRAGPDTGASTLGSHAQDGSHETSVREDKESRESDEIQSLQTYQGSARGDGPLYNEL